MGREQRESQKSRISVLDSIRGHDSTVPHTWNHTMGQCPKCGCNQHVMMFCAPDEARLPKVRGCELEGEHVHRICQSCRYPWIERPLDQAMLSEREGRMVAESELAAAMAVILESTDGAVLDSALVKARRGWVIEFARSQETGTLILRVHEPDAPKGEARHPEAAEDFQGGDPA